MHAKVSSVDHVFSKVSAQNSQKNFFPPNRNLKFGQMSKLVVHGFFGPKKTKLPDSHEILGRY